MTIEVGDSSFLRTLLHDGGTNDGLSLLIEDSTFDNVSLGLLNGLNLCSIGFYTVTQRE